jgi:hypothetical protein
MFWLGIIVSLCYVPGITGAYIATQWPVLALVMPFWLLRSGRFTPLHLVGILFVTYAAIQILWTVNVYGAVYGFWLLTIWATIVWFGNAVPDADLRELYKGLAVGAAVSSFVAVLQHFGIGVVPRMSFAPAGLYVNSVQQSVVLALLAIALVTEGLWLWVLPLVPGLVLADSRSGVITVLVGLLGCLMRNLLVPAFIIATAAMFYLSHPLSSDVQRLYIWDVAWRGLTWLGWGTGAFYSILLGQNGTTFFPEYAHNDFLQLAFEYGIGALLPVTILTYALWRADAKQWPIVLAFCAAMCFSMPLFMPIAAFLGLISVGHVIRLYGVPCDNRHVSGQHGLSRYSPIATTCRGDLPLASNYSAKG